MMGEVIRVSGRAPDVGNFLREAMLSQRFADVALCCPGGQRFLAHRLVLSAASPYLQEVLLAHSKATTHCEPITVILAEVEAPELAAILGFVYTGTATVPRPRLEAFLRAAEALHIRLPPVPVVMTCADADCKQEDVKDAKVSPRYLRCEQYPLCDRWYRARAATYEDESRIEKKETYERVSCNESPDVSRILDRPMLMDRGNPCGQQRWTHDGSPYPTFWQLGAFRTHERNGDSDRRLGQGLEKDTGASLTDVREDRTMGSVPRLGESGDYITEKNSTMDIGGANCESRLRLYPQEVCQPERLADGFLRLETFDTRMGTDYGRVRPGNHVTKASNEMVGREQTMGEITRDDGTTNEGRLGGVPTREGPLEPAITSSRYVARSRSFEKQEYGQMGEDLSCAESCCRWRPPRRHVANRVTASPWRQIVRPHHSPKIQPIVLQSQGDDADLRERLQSPSEPPRVTVPSSSPKDSSLNLQKPTLPRNDAYYGFEVPIPCESTTFRGHLAPTDPSTLGSDTRVQDFYSGHQMPYAPTTQQVATSVPIVPVVPVAPSLRGNESLFHPAQPLPARSGLIVPTETVRPNEIACEPVTRNYQTVTPVQSKPELSHPISRLCDTVEPMGKSEVLLNLDARKPEEEIRNEDKILPRVFVNSDSNNNEATVISNNLSPRGRSGGSDDHRCEQCGKTFVTRASLKVHSRTHSGEKPFRCADCGKQFSQLRNYKYHRSVHEGTREFAATCPECGKYFNDRGYLSSHMKIHRNRKEYGCTECGKSFNQRVAYNMHVRIHTGVKPHQCEQCGKAFSRKMLLKQHLRTHSGERPYQCQVCQKAFADRSNMTLHTRLHSGLKPYQCTLCTKAFTKKHHLKTHLNYHTGTKPYSCPNCGLRFSQSSNMRTHFKKCSLNNPGGVKTLNNENNNGVGVGTAKGESENGVLVEMIGRAQTEALTPPNSDQESSIMTPISKTNVVTEGTA